MKKNNKRNGKRDIRKFFIHSNKNKKNRYRIKIELYAECVQENFS